MAKVDRTDAFSAILGTAKAAQGRGNRELPLDEIRLNPEQPRKFFDKEALAALTISVKKNGVLQPILVRESGDSYELVAGERRFRAAQRAGLETIPAVIREVSDQESLEIALIENLQREDLNPVEETDATLKLLSLKLHVPVQEVLEAIRQSHYKALGRTGNTGVINAHVGAVEELFRSIGRYTASSFYSHRVPLLKFPPDLLEVIRSGQLEYSKAHLLVRLKDEVQRAELLQRTIAKSLSREQLKAEVEALTKRFGGAPNESERIDVSRLKRKLTLSRIHKLPVAKQRELDKLLVRIDALLAD